MVLNCTGEVGSTSLCRRDFFKPKWCWTVLVRSGGQSLCRRDEIMALFILRKIILQTHLCSHPVGLDVWFLVGNFIYFQSSCVRTAKALAWLRRSDAQAHLSLRWSPVTSTRATDILKSKSVRSLDDVIRTYVWQSQIAMKTNDSSFSSTSVSEIDHFSNTLYSLNWPEAFMGGKKAKTCLSKFDIKFKRSLQTESQIPGLSEWLGMRS